MKLPYFKFMVQDYLSGDIQACDLETQAVFVNLLCLMWRDGGKYSKPIAVLCQRCKCTIDELQERLDMLKELGIIYVDDDGYLRVKFVDEQLKELTQDHNNHVVAGKAGAQKRWGKQGYSTAIAPPCHTESEANTETEAESDTKADTKSKHISSQKEGESEREKTWRDDFAIYKAEVDAAVVELMDDNDFIKQQERFHPDVDIRLSLEKAHTNFWGTEAGWKHKKKSRSASVDWRRTFTNAIDMNRVFKPRNPQKKKIDHSSLLG